MAGELNHVNLIEANATKNQDRFFLKIRESWILLLFHIFHNIYDILQPEGFRDA